jgi:hypothetical protein
MGYVVFKSVVLTTTKMWSSMVVKCSVINTINDHIQFPVVTFSTTTQCVDVDALLAMTTFLIITTTIFIVNIITPPCMRDQ